MKNKLLNKALFLLAVAFFLISLLNLLVIFQAVTTSTTTRAVGVGYIRFCISHSPTLNVSDQTLLAGDSFLLQVNYTNPNNATLAFYDNTSLFAIDSSTGIISFTPSVNDAGSYSVLIGMNETDSCRNVSLTNTPLFLIMSERHNSTLEAWDDGDAKAGNQTRYRNEQVAFFANYTNSTKSSINGSGIYCEIKFNITGNFSEPVNMSFNVTSALYSHVRSFNISTTIFWNVFCNGSASLHKSRNITDNITIPNRAPVLTTNLPNQTWNEDTIRVNGDLDDYFTDPDNDSMNFSNSSVSNIRISIDNASHVVTFTPEQNWYGNRTVVFYATDYYNSTGQSNIVYLSVIQVPSGQPSTPQQALATASAGSLGGSAGTTVVKQCEELWECSKWGDCLPTGIQLRTCIELSDCGTSYKKPGESQNCNYIPTCNDLVKNQNETGVDCGGPCLPCPTCSDGVQNQAETGVDCGGPCRLCSTCSDGTRNQGEEGIDCGGPCLPCPTCYDGLRNQGEEGADCGGPCKACPSLQIPTAVKKGILPALITLVVSALLFGLISYRLRRYVHPYIARFIMKIMQIAGIIKKEAIMPEELGLRDFALFRLQQMEGKLAREEPNAIFKEFLDLMKTFFKGLFQTQYEFTYEELMNAVEKEKITVTLKIVLITFLKKLSDLEYAAIQMDRQKMQNLIGEAKVLVDLTTRRALSPGGEKKKRKNALSEANRLVSETNRALSKGSAETAVNFYKSLIAAYNQMDNEKKAKVYDKIVELHKNIEKEIRKNEERANR